MTDKADVSKVSFEPTCSKIFPSTIDGRYVEAERNLSLHFRGSRNQRIIDVANSTLLNKVVEYKLY